MDLRHSLFIGNKAAYGGAIASASDVKHFKLTNSRLLNNTASSDGGALLTESAQVMSQAQQRSCAEANIHLFWHKLWWVKATMMLCLLSSA